MQQDQLFIWARISDQHNYWISCNFTSRFACKLWEEGTLGKTAQLVHSPRWLADRLSFPHHHRRRRLRWFTPTWTERERWRRRRASSIAAANCVWQCALLETWAKLWSKILNEHLVYVVPPRWLSIIFEAPSILWLKIREASRNEIQITLRLKRSCSSTEFSFNSTLVREICGNHHEHNHYSVAALLYLWSLIHDSIIYGN